MLYTDLHVSDAMFKDSAQGWSGAKESPLLGSRFSVAVSCGVFRCLRAGLERLGWFPVHSGWFVVAFQNCHSILRLGLGGCPGHCDGVVALPYRTLPPSRHSVHLFGLRRLELHDLGFSQRLRSWSPLIGSSRGVPAVHQGCQTPGWCCLVRTSLTRFCFPCPYPPGVDLRGGIERASLPASATFQTGPAQGCHVTGESYQGQPLDEQPEGGVRGHVEPVLRETSQLKRVTCGKHRLCQLVT